MKTLRHYAAAFVAALGISLPASATTYGIDYTDLWFNPAESGWGVNVIQQFDTLFATLFVYGSDNSARWFVASDLRGSQNSFSGALYQTTGPAFSAPWSGGPTVTPVGSMTFTFSSWNAGTLTYTVSGQTVIKQIQRQTFRANSLAATYLGGMTVIGSACSNPAENGQGFLATGRLVVSGSTSVSLRVEFTNSAGQPGVCTWTGTYSPSGRLGTISGNYVCQAGSAASSGTFTMVEVDVSRNGFNASYNARDQFCTYNGNFGGVRDVL